MFKKLLRIIYYTLISARITTWIRIFAEMFLGFAIAKGRVSSDLSSFILGFIAAGPLLWTGAYMLNDLTDIKYDLQHIMRKKRPIVQGLPSKTTALCIIIFLVSLAVVVGFFVHVLFAAFLMLLFFCQIMYTTKPFRFKEKFILDLGINSICAGLRFILGYLTVINSFNNFPIFFLLFAMSLKMLLFIGHRLQNRDLEINNNIKSTVATLSLYQIKYVISIVFLWTGFLYYFSIFYYSFNINMIFLPLLFALVMLPFFSSLKRGYLLTQEKKLNNRIYLYIVFLLFSFLVFISIKK